MSGELKVDKISSSTNGTIVEVDGDLAISGQLSAGSCDITGNVDTVDGLHGTANPIGAENEENTLATKGAVKAYIDDRVPVGSIMMWSLGAPPIGWLECNGDWKPVADFGELYNTIGGVYGFNAAGNTFKLPDYRGYFLRGWDHGAGNDPDAGSRKDRGDGTSGDAVGTVEEDSVANHPHECRASTYTSNAAPSWNSDTTKYYPGTTLGSGNWTSSIQDNINSNETRPKNINVMFIIKI